MEDNKWKKLGITAIVVTVCLVIYFNMPSVCKLLGLNLSEYAKNLVNELVEFGIFYLGAVILKRADIIKFKKEGFGIGFLIFLLPFLQIVSTIGQLQKYYAQYGTIMTISVAELIILILFTLSIGMAEETLFRGIVQNALHDFFGEKSQGSIRLAIFIQALLFGGIHLFNILSGSDVSSAVIQAISCVGMGALFGAMYYRSNKNLWVPIVFHGFNDLRGLIHTGTLLGSSLEDNLTSYSASASTAVPANIGLWIKFAVVGAITVVYLVVFLIATRKKAIDKYLK